MKRPAEHAGLPMDASAEAERERQNSWLKRLGWAGFLFFLLKGLLWLALFLGACERLLG